jgi:hypothetical protein
MRRETHREVDARLLIDGMVVRASDVEEGENPLPYRLVGCAVPQPLWEFGGVEPDKTSFLMA